MDRFARVVLGYHGCDADFADQMLTGKIEIGDWQPSKNRYDWLGHGIYFWEHGPERARAWAAERKKKGVLGAVIQLGRCLDFSDTRYTEILGLRYHALAQVYRDQQVPLPTNRDKRRDLDCLVVNDLVQKAEDLSGDGFQTVRCPFLEGRAAFPSSGILKETHIQLAVVDHDCILGVFRPNLNQ